MKRLLGPVGGPIAFFLVAALVFAGLGWVTYSALGVEQAQREAAARAELGNNLRVAMWRLDSRMLPSLGVEDSRPFYHYAPADTADTFNPSMPLLVANLPDWEKLHFQLDPGEGWCSPQVLPTETARRIGDEWPDLPMRNLNGDRSDFLNKELKPKFPVPMTCEQFAATFPNGDNGEPQPDSVPNSPAQQVINGIPNLPPVVNPSIKTIRIFGIPVRIRTEQQLLGYNGRPDEQKKASETNQGLQIPQGQPNMYGGRGGQRANPRNSDNNSKDFETRQQTSNKASQDARGVAGNEVMNYSPLSQNSADMNLKNFNNGFNNTVTGLGGGNGSVDKSKEQQNKDAIAKMAPRDGKTDPNVGKPQSPGPAPQPVPPLAIHLGSMRPQWVTAPDGSEILVLVRAAKFATKTVYQGVVLDWPKLEAALKDEVKDLFPDAKLLPVKDPETVSLDRAMTALPVQLDPGPEPPLPPVGWTPLRLGLVLSWVAAIVAFAAVGFSGWSLIDLAERRIRFVSAVTHELRTPLTSLRLYLDLLVSGMIQDEAKKQEYLNTLATESDRLHRLIDNVLDFAKLEKRRKNGDIRLVKVNELLDQLRQTWTDRVAQDGKELIVISMLPAEREVHTDAAMIQQIMANLIDNARKYTRDVADKRIWLWAKPGSGKSVFLEVEDRGPGVPAKERRSIFKPFRRGKEADSTGGAGLGLALAKSWAEVLGAKLTYCPADGGTGACFRLELPGV